MKILPLLFLCLSLNAQEWGMGQLPMLSSESTTSVTPHPFITTNLYLRWTFTNLTPGNVSDWVDLIQGFHMTNAVAGKQPAVESFLSSPTNYGVHFTNISYLTGTNVDNGNLSGLNPDIFIIYKVPYMAVPSQAFILQGALGQSYVDASGSRVGAWKRCCFPTIDVTGPVGTNAIVDVFSGLNVGVETAYTNGVHDAVAHNLAPGWKLMGDPFSVPFYIYEIFIYTNLNLTAGVAQANHDYKVAVYGP